MKAEAKFVTRVSGHFTLTVHGGQRGTQVLAEFDNLITDGGLNDLFTSTASTFCARCQLGTGTAAPAVTDSALSVPGATTTTVTRAWPGGGTGGTYVAGPPDYVSDYTTLRFATGTATGTWTEIAMQRSATPNTMFSRALILDGGGSPTSITVLADESLDVTYTLRLYPPASDVTGNVTLDGISYAYTIRPSAVDDGHWTPAQLQGYGLAGKSGTGMQYVEAYDNVMGARTAKPTGTATPDYCDLVPAAYTAGSFQRQFEVTFPLTKFNIAGGIKSLFFAPTTASGHSAWTFQMEFNPKVPKVATKVLKLTFTLAVARRP